MPTEEQSAGMALADVADRVSSAFARELARILARVERSLLPLLGQPSATARISATRHLTLRTELRELLSKAGYDALMQTASVEAVAQMADAYRSLPRAKALGAISPTRLRALQVTLEADLLGLGDVASQQVWRAAVTGIYANVPPERLIAQLATQLERSFATTQTIFDTQTSILGRQIERIATQGREDQAFLYVGPIDSRTREWCLQHVGLVLSRDRIDLLDNGQLPNTFLSGGGYSCRHSFLAVSDPELVALVDTGTKADGYVERVAAARALKTQNRRLRELRRVAA